jgi:hypothetical protein
MSIKLTTRQRWLFFWLIALIIALGLNYQNRHLTVKQYNISDQRWPIELNGWRLVQLSDLHSQAVNGPNNQCLLTTIKQLQPDIITITGDTFDGRATNIPANLLLIQELSHIAPVYLTIGNHEFYNDDYSNLIKQAEQAGAIVLRDQIMTIETKEQKITIVGLDDPTVLGGPLPQTVTQKIISQKLTKLINQAGGQLTQPVILLAHRPELWPQYLIINPLAILSGHTHGGQIRLPLIGALYVPNQKLLPNYDQGLFSVGNSQLIVNSGIGNSLLNQRFNNYPELVSLTFYHQ